MDTSGLATIQYFEKNNYVGERTQYFCSASNGGPSFSAYYPHIAFVCPHCGELWGRAVCEYHFPYRPIVGSAWSVEVRRCAKHGDGTFLGMLPIVNPQAHLDSCSLPFLQREAMLLLLRQPA